MFTEFNAAKLRGQIGALKADHSHLRMAKLKVDGGFSYWLNWNSGEICLGVYASEEQMDELLTQEGF
jgi:hypothetical protein